MFTYGVLEGQVLVMCLVTCQTVVSSVPVACNVTDSSMLLSLPFLTFGFASCFLPVMQIPILEVRDL